jgi:hypothetical protein
VTHAATNVASLVSGRAVCHHVRGGCAREAPPIAIAAAKPATRAARWGKHPIDFKINAIVKLDADPSRTLHS